MSFTITQPPSSATQTSTSTSFPLTALTSTSFPSTALISTTKTSNESTPTQQQLHLNTRPMQRTSTPTKMSEKKKEDARRKVEINKMSCEEDSKKGNVEMRKIECKDVAKNIEIRRMSSTEEGDKVLNSAWDSPEKEEKGRTPLEMVQNIVSR